MKYSSTVVVILAILGLMGCGAGSSDNVDVLPPPAPTPAPSPTPLAPSSPATVIEVVGTTQVQSGAAAGFVVVPLNQENISSITWSIPEGINALTLHTQAIGFDAPPPGNYSISFEATTMRGIKVQQTIEFTVESSQTHAVARLSHQATEGGRVSLRVDNVSDKSIASIEWRQISGPSPTDTTFDDNADIRHNIFFTAPRVNRDTLLTYEAEVSFADGVTEKETVHVLVKDVAINEQGYFPRNNMIVTSQMFPYRSNSPHAEALQSCVYNNQISQSCSFSTLPLLGQETLNPSIDDVLNRTLVSHQWMGDAFRDFLMNSATRDDMLSLLRATTAVVISYDVRPSFYWVATGAIYLDANNFWRTAEERDTLNTRPDFRSNFGNDLSFVTTWRYIKNGQYFFPQPGLNPALRRSRDVVQLEAALAWLMYHELAHANDYFNYTTWGRLRMSDTPLGFFNANSSQSDTLTTSLPLTSAELHALAQVRFGGTRATAEQRATEAIEVADWFDTDAAISFYSYFTPQEDFASLVERFMMQYRLGAAADIGVFRQADIDNQSFTLTWGQRYRFASPQVIPRVVYAVESILPELDVRMLLRTMPTPIDFSSGDNWFDILADGQRDNSTTHPSFISPVFIKPEHFERQMPMTLHPLQQ